MKIASNKKTMEIMLLQLQPFLEKKDTTQITSHVLIETKDNNLIMKATNFEDGLEIVTGDVIVDKEGSATANGKKLLEIIRGLKNEDIVISATDKSISIKQHNASFRLPVFNPKDFPIFPSIEGKNKIDINNDDFLISLKKTLPSIPSDNPKYEINGALIDIKKDFTNLVSTDTRRLAVVKLDTHSNQEISLIIPKKAVNEIIKIFSDSPNLEMFYNENDLIVKSLNHTFFTRLINGKYPDYSRVVPNETTYNFTIQRDNFLDAVKQILTINEEITIEFNKDKIILSAIGDFDAEANIEVENKTPFEEPFKISVNGKYILDFMSNIDYNEFLIGINGDNIPFVLKSNNVSLTVMPIAVN